MEDFKELDFLPEDTEETVEAKLKEKLGIGLADLKLSLTTYVINKAEELTHDFANITPYGDYEHILEDNDGMATFLKDEASKPDNWKLLWVQTTKAGVPMLQFCFSNTAVDEGEGFVGNVYLGLNGKIKHAFAQGDR